MGIHGEESYLKSFLQMGTGVGVGLPMIPEYEPAIPDTANDGWRNAGGKNRVGSAGTALPREILQRSQGGYGPQVEMNGKLARMLHDRRERGT